MSHDQSRQMPPQPKRETLDMVERIRDQTQPPTGGTDRRLKVEGAPDGRSDASQGIGQPPKIAPDRAKLSDSQKYRREFELSEDDLARLGWASSGGQDQVNAYWSELATERGFVWSTVADLKLYGDERATFTAEVEGEVPPIPAFEAWFATAPIATIDRFVAQQAFEAGSRHATLTLAQLDRSPPTIRDLDQIIEDEAQKAYLLGSAQAGWKARWFWGVVTIVAVLAALFGAAWSAAWGIAL